MGTKSLSRRQRDAFAAKNTVWDELQKQYVNNQSQLNNVVSTTKAFFETEGVLSYLTAAERVHASRTIGALSTDVRAFQSRLTDIYNRHKHYSGRVSVGKVDKNGKVLSGDGFDEYNKAVACFDAYVAYVDDFNKLVMPLYRAAMGISSVCEKRMTEIANSPDTESSEQEAQDQNEKAL